MASNLRPSGHHNSADLIYGGDHSDHLSCMYLVCYFAENEEVDLDAESEILHHCYFLYEL